MPDDDRVKPRPVGPDEKEKTPRQRLGLDGDALAEIEERTHEAPHEEVFDAPETHREKIPQPRVPTADEDRKESS